MIDTVKAIPKTFALIDEMGSGSSWQNIMIMKTSVLSALPLNG
jgi:hypothetical protein